MKPTIRAYQVVEGYGRQLAEFRLGVGDSGQAYSQARITARLLAGDGDRVRVIPVVSHFAIGEMDCLEYKFDSDGQNYPLTTRQGAGQ